MEAMRRGDLQRAWAIADGVLAGRDPATRDDPARPYHERWVWDGRSLAGRDVVVRCYHGLGDTLQFARYLPALRARAASVTLEVQPELHSLLAAAPGADRVVPFNVDAPIPASHDIEIMELQHALRLPATAASTLQISPTPAPGAAIGVCWQAGAWQPSRSIPLDLLRPLLPEGAVSLQRGEVGMPDPLAGCMDVRVTAGLVASLACVITVDTMIAHLAGALGRPVYLLLKADADWRWGSGDRTPWYPATRIYRQAVPGDWSEPLARLADALRAGG
jgi:hypothetical protein